jgi:signal transduction histidine kinase
VQGAIAAGATVARDRGVGLLAGSLGVGLVGVVGAVYWRGHRRRVEQRDFRVRLARDLHDELGSNLAAIARLGEVANLEASDASSASDWDSVRQLAAECIQAMQESLWLLGGRQAPGGDLLDRLEQTAGRMLPGVELRWQRTGESVSGQTDETLHRELFLTVKELLANVTRHAHATRVDCVASVVDGRLTLRVADNGRGFEPAAGQRGMGLDNARRRITKLKGSLTVNSAEGCGTQVEIRLPIGARKGR